MNTAIRESSVANGRTLTKLFVYDKKTVAFHFATVFFVIGKPINHQLGWWNKKLIAEKAPKIKSRSANRTISKEALLLSSLSHKVIKLNIFNTVLFINTNGII